MQEQVIKKYQEFIDNQGDTLSRLLDSAGRQVAEETLRELRKQGQSSLTSSQLNILQVLCLKGMNATLLAQRLEMSKQAIGQFVDELEQQGLVSRSPDPNDSRSKLIKHTKKGYTLVSKLIDGTLVVEHSLANKLGEKKYLELKSLLQQITRA